MAGEKKKKEKVRIKYVVVKEKRRRRRRTTKKKTAEEVKRQAEQPTYKGLSQGQVPVPFANLPPTWIRQSTAPPTTITPEQSGVFQPKETKMSDIMVAEEKRRLKNVEKVKRTIPLRVVEQLIDTTMDDPDQLIGIVRKNIKYYKAKNDDEILEDIYDLPEFQGDMSRVEKLPAVPVGNRPDLENPEVSYPIEKTMIKIKKKPKVPAPVSPPAPAPAPAPAPKPFSFVSTLPVAPSTTPAPIPLSTPPRAPIEEVVRKLKEKLRGYRPIVEPIAERIPDEDQDAEIANVDQAPMPRQLTPLEQQQIQRAIQSYEPFSLYKQ